jgi:antitoxin ParD1/3/4
MSIIAKRTVSLPQEQSAFIDAKVASGDYASASEVVRAGLRALRERDEAVERWLRDEVAPTYDAMAEDPGRGMRSGRRWPHDAARGLAGDPPDGDLCTGGRGGPSQPV